MTLQQNVTPPPTPHVSQVPTPQEIQQITDRAVAEALAGLDRNQARTIHIGEMPGLPGGMTITRPGGRDFGPMPPSASVAIGFLVICAITLIAWPIARALGRRIDRKNQPLPANSAMTDQLQRIEQAVEAMSIEIERISESQRFMAKVQAADRASIPANNG